MLAPRVIARIGGFPDEFALGGSKREVRLAVGNAVTPKTSRLLLTRILAGPA